jgi:DNA-binding response OmpR family regulator
MLTAKDAEVDKVLGLELGADDYVTKPFSTAELASRVRALIRRVELDRQATSAPVREVGGLRIDLVRHEVAVAGRPVRLTRSELKLLSLLSEEPGRAFTRRELMHHLWDTTSAESDHACDVHISNLRRKLEDDPRRPRRIVTVRGVGYRLDAA